MNYVSGQRLIKVSVYPEDENSISVNVADSGSGIPLEQRELIFAPFYTTKEGWMGVGLYWVRRLVSGIGGRIVVDSPNELGGTTFRIMLPQALEE
jgi:signal transduction histidine kinase